MARDRLFRQAKTKGYGLKKSEKITLAGKKNTRGRAKLRVMIKNKKFHNLRPAVPSIFYKNGRPSWSNKALLWSQLGGKGNVQCAEDGCNVLADSLDHILDWKSYIQNNANVHFEIIGKYQIQGYTKEEVNRLYNDIENLQPMCTFHNSSKNGKKGIDLTPDVRKVW